MKSPMTRMAGSNKALTNFIGVKPEYGAIGAENIGRRAQEFATVTQGNALAANAGMKGLADIQSAQAYADAGVAAAGSAAQSSMVGSVAEGLIGFGKGQTAKGGIFNKAGKGLSPAMQQASILGGLNLGNSLGGIA